MADSVAGEVVVSLEQVYDYEFRIRFEKTALPDLTTDEGSPLGRDAGPNPVRLLVVSVANCLAASLLFALRKFREQPGTLRATATAKVARNNGGRWRVSDITVEIRLSDSGSSLNNAARALAQFENFCIVTESVRHGVPVWVTVLDREGQILHKSMGA